MKIVEGVPEMRWTWAQVETYILNGVDWIYRTRLKNRMIICLLSPTIAEKDGRSKFTWLFSSLIVCLTTKTTMTDSSVECVDSRVQRTSFFFLLFFCSAVTFFSLFFFLFLFRLIWQLTVDRWMWTGGQKERKERKANSWGIFFFFFKEPKASKRWLNCCSWVHSTTWAYFTY